MTTTQPAIYNQVGYAKAVEHRTARGKVTAENWHEVLLGLQETDQARAAMRDVWAWEMAGCPEPSEQEKAEALPLDPLVCPGCMASFVPKGGRQIYCTSECRIRCSRRKESKPETVTCANPECGVAFERITSKKRYCCGSCNSRALYLLKKAEKADL